MGRLFDTEAPALQGTPFAELVAAGDRERVGQTLRQGGNGSPMTVQFGVDRNGRDPLVVKSE